MDPDEEYINVRDRERERERIEEEEELSVCWFPQKQFDIYVLRRFIHTGIFFIRF